jgi:hypothetical protein
MEVTSQLPAPATLSPGNRLRYQLDTRMHEPSADVTLKRTPGGSWTPPQAASTVERLMDDEFKELGKKWPQSQMLSRELPGKTEKTTKNGGQDCRCPSRDSSRTSSEHEPTTVTTALVRTSRERERERVMWLQNTGISERTFSLQDTYQIICETSKGAEVTSWHSDWLRARYGSKPYLHHTLTLHILLQGAIQLFCNTIAHSCKFYVRIH